jgi:hypothetical protein
VAGGLQPGVHEFDVDLGVLGTQQQNYVYQIHVVNHAGTFTDVKLLSRISDNSHNN